MKDKILKYGIPIYKELNRHYTMLPRSILVETTKLCRRNYKEGSISSKPGETNLTIDTLEKIRDSIPLKLIRFEGDGEPTANPYFWSIISWCGRHNIKTMMTTNGTLLTESRVKLLQDNGMLRLHVSFDGARKETFEKYKLGAKYEKVIENCKLVGNSNIQLFMSVVLFSEEILEQLDEYIDLAVEVGATGIHYMKPQIDSTSWVVPNFDNYSSIIEGFSRRAKEAGLQVVGTCKDKPTFVKCYDPFIQPFILLNGDVYSCTYMAALRRTEVYQGVEFKLPYQNYKMGNIKEQSLKDIWENRKYKETS